MAQVALAWTLSKEFVTAPIVGVTSIEQLEDLVGTSCCLHVLNRFAEEVFNLLAGVHIKLTEEEEKLIDEPYLPRAILGHS
ncbi:hypothetical protein FRC03_006611 [Tulasnella sp. 419]|nr:hypothetical protein FRC03_006611 [Tulasnella sp. 419]